MNDKPKSVSELFPSRWLKPEDLAGRPYALVIESVTIEKVHSPFTNTDELKAAVRFQSARKALVLNRTQAAAIAEIAGSEMFEDWNGVRVLLRPGTAKNKKPTIIIGRPAGEELNR